MTERYRKLCYQIFCIMIAGLLMTVYFYNMPKLPTLMELPDETGYLWNAAYFLGIDWDDLGTSAYYGYGYSIFLIPLLKFCGSGIALIKGAYVVNIIFVAGLYIVFVLLLKNLFNRCSMWIPVIAGVSCSVPYLFVSSYKVICENCFTFFCSLLILLYYKCMKTRKLLYYVLSGLTAVFIPFIHTRGIVVSGVFAVFCLLDFFTKRKLSYKQIVILMGAFLSTFLILYLIKKSNLDFRSALRLEKEYQDNTTNLISSNYLIGRLRRIIDVGIINYLGSFISRLFYSVCTTGGMVLLGIANIGNMIKGVSHTKDSDNDSNREKVYARNITLLMVNAIFLLCIAATVFNNIGSNFQYIYYGRYYEHVIPIMLCCSLYVIFSADYFLKPRTYMLAIAFTSLLGLFSYHWVNGYLEEITTSVDTARTAAFNAAIELDSKYINVMCYSALISVLTILVCFLVYQKKNIRIVFIVLMILIFWNMNQTCVEAIQNTAIKAEADYAIFNYIRDNIDTQKIYAINDHSYKYESVIQKAQVLIKDYRVNELDYDLNNEKVLDCVENGDYVIVYSTNKLALEKEKLYVKIMDGKTFKLYQKR